MAVVRPHQAVYWQVKLGFDLDRRAEIKRWCGANIVPQMRGIAWVGPRLPSPTDWWDRRETEEIWHFSRYEDAVMFDMVWGEVSWQTDH